MDHSNQTPAGNKADPNRSTEFPANALLGLEITEGSSINFRLKPGQTVVVGRKTGLVGPFDIDLSPYNAYAMGVSRSHAELRRTDDGKGIELRDLGSSNGTFLNEERATPYYKYRVGNGDSLRFGKLQTRVVFVLGTAPVNQEPTPAAPEINKPTLDLTAAAEKAAKRGGVVNSLDTSKLPDILGDLGIEDDED